MVAAVIYPTGAQLQSPPNGFIEMFGNSPQTSLLRVTTGTFVANSTSTVTVAATAVTANSIILISLNTPSTVGATAPAVQTITAGTGFTVVAAASDVSTYNYMILG